MNIFERSTLNPQEKKAFEQQRLMADLAEREAAKLLMTVDFMKESGKMLSKAMTNLTKRKAAKLLMADRILSKVMTTLAEREAAKLLLAIDFMKESGKIVSEIKEMHQSLIDLAQAKDG